jgi:HNH endonuclease
MRSFKEISKGKVIPCWYCGDPATGLDHVVPKTKGGPNARPNRIPACFRCDGFKGNRTPLEFMHYLKYWLTKSPRTTKHSVVKVRALGWKFFGELNEEVFKKIGFKGANGYQDLSLRNRTNGAGTEYQDNQPTDAGIHFPASWTAGS